LLSAAAEELTLAHLELAIQTLVPEPRHEQQPIVGAVRALSAFAGTTNLGVGAQQLDDDFVGRERSH
jgi:hypothetical protein